MTSSNNRLPLTLAAAPSLLDGLELYEPIDIDVLNKLINSTLLLEDFHNPSAKHLYSNELQQLLKYKANYLKKKGVVRVKYNKTTGMPFGRSNPARSLGLFSIRRQVRHTLAKKRMVDADVTNAHLDILLQVARENNLPCECLADYVNSRQKYLTATMDNFHVNRDAAKRLFIIYVFGGGFNSWCDEYKLTADNVEPNVVGNDGIGLLEPDEFAALKNELRTIQDIILKANPEIARFAKKRKAEQHRYNFNLAGTVTSYFLQEYEIRVLECVYKYCLDNGFIQNNICVLCADGLMLEKQYWNDSLLQAFSDIVYEKVGLRLTFITKEMDEDYLDILDDNQIAPAPAAATPTAPAAAIPSPTEIVTGDALPFIRSDDVVAVDKPKHDVFVEMKGVHLELGVSTAGFAEHFLKVYGGKFVFCNNTLYKYNGVYWEKDDENNTIIHTYISNEYHDYLIDNFNIFDKWKMSKCTTEEAYKEHGKLVTFFRKQMFKLKEFTKRCSIVSDVIIYITNNKLKFDNDPYLFAFENCVFDLRLGVPIPPKADQYISMTTGFKYERQFDDEKQKNELLAIFDKIFYNSPEIRDLYLTILSTGLCGIPVEKFVLVNGSGGNGKGVINELFMKLLGEYGYLLPVSVLVNKVKAGSNPELAGVSGKRFVLAREPDRETRLNAGVIKDMTGGEAISARMNYSNKTEVDVKMTMVLECNDKPLLGESTKALLRRLLDIPFKSTFLPPELYEELDEEDKEKGFYLINQYLKSVEFKCKYRQTLFDILLGYFDKHLKADSNLVVPKEVQNRNETYLQNSDEFYGWFYDNFQKTGNKTDFVKMKDVFNNYKNSEFFNNMTKKQKRENNYKNFIAKVEGNMFLKQFVKENKDKVCIIKNHVPLHFESSLLIKTNDNDDLED